MSPPILRLSFVFSASHLIRMVSLRCGGYSSPLSMMSSMASSSYFLMKVSPLATSKRYLSCGPNPS